MTFKKNFKQILIRHLKKTKFDTALESVEKVAKQILKILSTFDSRNCANISKNHYMSVNSNSPTAYQQNTV